jgi:hypothetical protein
VRALYMFYEINVYVHLYVVVHFHDLFEWRWICSCILIVFIYICIAFWDPVIERGAGLGFSHNFLQIEPSLVIIYRLRKTFLQQYWSKKN